MKELSVYSSLWCFWNGATTAVLFHLRVNNENKTSVQTKRHNKPHEITWCCRSRTVRVTRNNSPTSFICCCGFIWGWSCPSNTCLVMDDRSGRLLRWLVLGDRWWLFYLTVFFLSLKYSRLYNHFYIRNNKVTVL